MKEIHYLGDYGTEQRITQKWTKEQIVGPEVSFTEHEMIFLLQYKSIKFCNHTSLSDSHRLEVF